MADSGSSAWKLLVHSIKSPFSHDTSSLRAVGRPRVGF